MEANYIYLNSLVNKNKSEFSRWTNLKWLDQYNVVAFQDKRNQLLTPLARPLFKETKPFVNSLSNGCQLCGNGSWSCLFITGKCNAGCFYCPAPQNTDETPVTQGLEFHTPEAYAHYIKYFDFKAVSFSGGEPLLFPERTLSYLKAVREICNSAIYTWMYTNGIAANTGILKQLAAAGLNEIRFDIGATGFTLEKVKLAKGIIPVITIEIPAIPEEKEHLIKLLPHMANAGVNNLNLHQLRMTAHNAKQIAQRNYSVLCAERPIVPASEITAIEILNAVKKQGINIGANYCSFPYKHRFQKAGFRRIITRTLYPQSICTENGYIREYHNNLLRYKKAIICSQPGTLYKPGIIHLGNQQFFFGTVDVLSATIANDYKIALDKLLDSEPELPPTDNFLFKIWQYEYIEKGLRDI